MRLRSAWGVGRVLCPLALCALLGVGQSPKRASTEVIVPRTWDDAAMQTLELPLAYAPASPKHVSADYYYRIPVRPIYKQYPVYAPGREPAGYWEWLQTQEPVVVWDGGHVRPRLRNKADWVKAGEIAFDSALFIDVDGLISVRDVRSRDWYTTGQVPVAANGVLPFISYVIREKGKVELGIFSCAMCHTRVMPDGSVVDGAQGNFPLNWAVGRKMFSGEQTRFLRQAVFATPFLKPDPMEQEFVAPQEQFIKKFESIPPGVIPRHRTNPIHPVQVPDLIGVEGREYLDRTGLLQQRSIVDMMRYAALNQGADGLANFDGFIPDGAPKFNKLPDPASPIVGGRYSDEQLYALSMYAYSLKPPPNPHKMTDLASRGQKVFEREGCGFCHAPPLYTNNKLTPEEGFTPPPGAAAKYNIATRSVGTDPGLATMTLRGTGYYKVPSLKGVWYRSMFGHSGWCATLEDWFDPRRVQDDYIPTGFKPNGDAPYAVQGHPFGLDLNEDDRKALITFLKTL